MDGNQVRAFKRFTLAGNPTTLSVDLGCTTRTQELVLTVTSSELPSTTDKNAPLRPSALLSEGQGLPKGRVSMMGFNGKSLDLSAGDLFAAGEYNNEVSWFPALTSVDLWRALDKNEFWRWAADVAPNPGNVSRDSLAKQMSALTDQMQMLAQVVGQASQSVDLSNDGTAQGILRFDSNVAREFAGYALQNQQLGRLASGAVLKRLLPVSIELMNAGGAFQLTIPAGNGDIEAVLDECKGTPWWSDLDRESTRPAAASQDNRVPDASPPSAAASAPPKLGDAAGIAKGGLAEAQSAILEPPTDSPLRTRILDGLRPEIEKTFGAQMRFVVKSLRATDRWAFVEADPLRKDGKEIDANKVFGDRLESMDGMRIGAILENVGSAWLLREHVIGPTDVWYLNWCGRVSPGLIPSCPTKQ